MKLKRFLFLPLLGLTGCIAFNQGSGYPIGAIYSDVVTPHAMDRAEVSGAGKTDDKRGEGCAVSILGLVATGDASVNAAKKSAGIIEVHNVEYSATNVLFFYAKTCTIVWGK